jgi:hypothetical protein
MKYYFSAVRVACLSAMPLAGKPQAGLFFFPPGLIRIFIGDVSASSFFCINDYCGRVSTLKKKPFQ